MPSKFVSLAFWSDTVERAASTAAQAAIAVLTAGSFGLVDVDWASLGSVAGLAALLSVLKAVAVVNPEALSVAKH